MENFKESLQIIQSEQKAKNQLIDLLASPKNNIKVAQIIDLTQNNNQTQLNIEKDNNEVNQFTVMNNTNKIHIDESSSATGDNQKQTIQNIV